MGTFKIEGGHQLKGKIQPQGAKTKPYKYYVQYSNC